LVHALVYALVCVVLAYVHTVVEILLTSAIAIVVDVAVAVVHVVVGHVCLLLTHTDVHALRKRFRHVLRGLGGVKCGDGGGVMMVKGEIRWWVCVYRYGQKAILPRPERGVKEFED
jgi:hypothetical protein